MNSLNAPPQASTAERAPRTVPKFMQVKPIELDGIDLTDVAFMRLKTVKRVHDESTAKIQVGT